MEMIYIALIGFYFVMWYLRFKTGARVWEFLTTGILIYFMIEFSAIPALLFTFIGISLFTIYDSFFGGGTV